MKSIIYISAAVILFSCNEKPSEENTTAAAKDTASKSSTLAVNVPEGTELWAEQVQSTTEISRPTDWEEKDWNDIYKNIDKERIFNSIKEGVMKGELKAYNYFDESQVYTPKDIDGILNFTSVIENYNQETGELKTRNVEQHLAAKDISVVKVKEKWLYDPKSYTMYKVVTDIGFFVNSYTGDSIVRGTKPLFYVKLGNAAPLK
jgi:hypothetical protein